ncbi:hypothetical protein [Amycolatopsis sp. NPDC051371]|uniref:hypothetical protein n=1 Tax=Amycolatopsis sp. NPDC051371 TaxID=3155800 RepID=UPI0034130CA2
MPDTWASAADVLTYTGETVTDDAMPRAQAVIDIESGRLFEDAERIGSRDRYWLKLATAYQAAWQKDQPDEFVRLDVKGTGSGQGSQEGNDSWLTLGPHAAQALRRVSWLGSGSLHVRAPGETPRLREPMGEDGDPGVWRPV